jgi:hypothetical protein
MEVDDIFGYDKLGAAGGEIMNGAKGMRCEPHLYFMASGLGSRPGECLAVERCGKPRYNGACGRRDMHGKAAWGAVIEAGGEIMNGAKGMLRACCSNAISEKRIKDDVTESPVAHLYFSRR